MPDLTRLDAIIKPAGPAPTIKTSTLLKSRIVAFSLALARQYFGVDVMLRDFAFRGLDGVRVCIRVCVVKKRAGFEGSMRKRSV